MDVRYTIPDAAIAFIGPMEQHELYDPYLLAESLKKLRVRYRFDVIELGKK